MTLKKIRSGERHDIYFYMDDDENCPAGAYLQELQNGGKRERQDAAVLVRRINDLSNFGPPRLKEHGHPLQGGEGVCELKASNGARLFWFYARGGIVVCSHGAHKPNSNRAYNPHIERARVIKREIEQQWESELQRRQVQDLKDVAASRKSKRKK